MLNDDIYVRINLLPVPTTLQAKYTLLMFFN